MLALFVLLISLGIFRALGAFGVSAFSTWIGSTRYALALMFLFTSTAHFNKTPRSRSHDAQGIFQSDGDGLSHWYLRNSGRCWHLIPRTRSLAGLFLLIFLFAVLPANIKAARESLSIGGRPATALWLRVPMQILFLVLISWSTQPWTLFSSLFKR